MRITNRVQRRQHIAGELGCFVKDRADEIGVIGFMSFEPVDAGKGIQSELDIGNRSIVGHDRPFEFVNK